LSTRHWNHDDFLFEEEMRKRKITIPRFMTIHQLMDLVIREVKQMTPAEKAEVRYEMTADMRMPKRKLLELPCDPRPQ
jgi:hypothetical protein